MIEQLREQVVTDLLAQSSVASVWPTWRAELQRRLAPVGAQKHVHQTFALGGKLTDVFQTTGGGDRDQSSVSGGGAAWESLVCWYMNLCLVGTDAIVAKKASDLPTCVRYATTVMYNSVASNSEADLVAVTFPPGALPASGEPSRAKLRASISTIAEQHFGKLGVAVIQCKTNWNDNAQIPMMWDMIYAARAFKGGVVTVGTHNFSVQELREFRYAFVTVPTNDPAGYKPTAMAVKRVSQLSGGNFWGRPTVQGVAQDVSEIFVKAAIGPNDGRGVRSAVAAAASIPAYFGV